MTSTQQITMLFAGTAGVLTVASLIALVLQRRLAGDGAEPVLANLTARIRAWWVLVALLGLTFLFGKAGVIALLGFASFAALREFTTPSDGQATDHRSLALAFYVVVPMQYAAIAFGWHELFSVLIPVWAFMLLPIVTVLRGDTRRFAARVSNLQWGLMIGVYCLSHLAALTTLKMPGDDGHSLLLIAFLVIVVQSSDVLQYVFGKLFGRRKIAPTISPSKTVAGTVGGITASTMIGAALWWITPFAFWQAALMAFVIGTMGFLGGLVMSGIKRDRGIKDWGGMIAGHGGVLDRLDSLVFSAPVFFYIVRYGWAA